MQRYFAVAQTAVCVVQTAACVAQTAVCVEQTAACQLGVFHCAMETDVQQAGELLPGETLSGLMTGETIGAALIDEKPLTTDGKPIGEEPIGEKLLDEKQLDGKPTEGKPIDEKPIDVASVVVEKPGAASEKPTAGNGGRNGWKGESTGRPKLAGSAEQWLEQTEGVAVALPQISAVFPAPDQWCLPQLHYVE